MGTVLNSLFGKGKGNYGDVEYWHGAERAGWLMKQGKPLLLRGVDYHDTYQGLCVLLLAQAPMLPAHAA